MTCYYCLHMFYQLRPVVKETLYFVVVATYPNRKLDKTKQTTMRIFSFSVAIALHLVGVLQSYKE